MFRDGKAIKRAEKPEDLPAFYIDRLFVIKGLLFLVRWIKNGIPEPILLVRGFFLSPSEFSAAFQQGIKLLSLGEECLRVREYQLLKGIYSLENI